MSYKSKEKYIESLENVEECENKLHISYHTSNFKTFENVDEFWEYYTQKAKDKHHYEILSLGENIEMKIKPYMDIEYYDDDVDKNEFLISFKTELKRFMKIYYPDAIPQIICIDSCGKYDKINKYSFHIIINNLGYFCNLFDCKIFVMSFIKFLNENDKVSEENKEILTQRICDPKSKRLGIPIDLNVYKDKWQLMRIPYSSKSDKDNRILCLLNKNHQKIPIDKLRTLDKEKIFITTTSAEKNEICIDNLECFRKKPMTPPEIKYEEEIDSEEIDDEEKDSENIEEDIEGLLDCLQQYRCDEYHSWSIVGIALYNYFDGSKEGFKYWVKWSKKSDAFDLEVCNRKWKNEFSQRTSQYNIGSLYFWAEEDNPKKYHEIMSNCYAKLAKNAIGNDTEIAELLYKIVGNKHRCYVDQSNGNAEWYYFDKHIFKKDYRARILNRIITKKLAMIYKILAGKLQNKKNNLSKYDNNDDDEENCELKNKITALNKEIKEHWNMYKKLASNTYKKSIIDEAVNYFEDKKFYIELNNNKNLMAFPNGILELDSGLFRDGCPEDYISFCAGVEYDPNLDTSELENEFLAKIITNEENRHYTLKALSTALSGYVKHQLLHFFSGDGSNGKSKLVEVLKTMFGDYAGVLGPSSLTGKGVDPDKPNPAFTKLKKKRFCVISEADIGVNLNETLAKGITGGDEIAMRGMYQDVEYVKLMVKIFWLVNDLVKIRSDGFSIWRRIRDVVFDSTFVDENPDPNNKEFLKNPKLDDDDVIMEYAKQMATLLAKYYRIQLKEGLTPPKDVLETTRNYRNSENIYVEFANDYIIKCENENSRTYIEFAELKNEFQDWYLKNNKGFKNRFPNNRDLIIKFTRFLFDNAKPEILKKGNKKIVLWRGYELNVEY